MKVKSETELAQSCLTLLKPMDCSLSGSSIHGIFQATVLEWGAIVFSHSRLPEAKLQECRPCTHLDTYQQFCPWTTAIKLKLLSRVWLFVTPCTKLLVEFACEVILPWAFVCWKILDYSFNFGACDWYFYAFCFFLVQFWKVALF